MRESMTNTSARQKQRHSAAAHTVNRWHLRLRRSLATTKPSPSRRRRARAAWLLALVGLGAGITIASLPPREHGMPEPVQAMALTPPRQIITSMGINGEIRREVIPSADELMASLTDPAAIKVASTAREPELPWKEITIKSGDTLSRIFARHDIQSDEANRIVKAHIDAKALNRLAAGQVLRLQTDAGGRILQLHYRLNESDSLQVRRNTNGYDVAKVSQTFETRRTYAAGNIAVSLFADGQSAGLSDPVIIQMVDIFGWDIDFAQDLRRGDSFAVIYEEKYWQGQKVADGAILAAEFINQGKSYRAVGHRTAVGIAGYYSPEGLSMRRPFLRSPMKVSRVTSPYSLSRYHPILQTWTAHRGVDYGAPTGTPVLATASGRVSFQGSKGGYGNAVVLKHGGSYSTLYAHLSGYPRGLRAGVQVEQGQVIGYVGSTGLATGPHLHYEFQVNGVHQNPLTLKFPQTEPIAPQYRAEFLQTARTFGTKLDLVGPSALASSR
jgi:murein DD-endopeptidase MepM/ murein hydrolase activator NlpD